MIDPSELIIDDSNWQEHTVAPIIDGQQMAFGAVPRDYSRHPVGSYGTIEPFAIPLIPRKDWSRRIRDMEQSQSRLSDLRMIGNGGNPIPSTNQGNRGYCWAHSPVSAALLDRARDNQPYAPLSAYAIACKVKNYRDQGGWNPQAVEFLIKTGCPTSATWGQQSVNPANDNARTWQEASRYKLTEGFMDLSPPIYDRNLTFDQLMTCLLLRIPCPVDLMWWRHSVCAADPVEFDASLALSDINRWGVRIWNSWSDAWGTLGMGVLRGSKAVPDGATACKVMTLH